MHLLRPATPSRSTAFGVRRRRPVNCGEKSANCWRRRPAAAYPAGVMTGEADLSPAASKAAAAASLRARALGMGRFAKPRVIPRARPAPENAQNHARRGPRVAHMVNQSLTAAAQTRSQESFAAVAAP